MTDVIIENGKCVGIKAENENGTYEIYAENTILASGGIGGTYQHSTNFPHLTGDAIEIAKKHNIRLEHLDYVQIHYILRNREDVSLSQSLYVEKVRFFIIRIKSVL